MKDLRDTLLSLLFLVALGMCLGEFINWLMEMKP